MIDAIQKCWEILSLVKMKNQQDETEHSKLHTCSSYYIKPKEITVRQKFSNNISTPSCLQQYFPYKCYL